jgi:hypothetical protein
MLAFDLNMHLLVGTFVVVLFEFVTSIVSANVHDCRELFTCHVLKQNTYPGDVSELHPVVSFPPPAPGERGIVECHELSEMSPHIDAACACALGRSTFERSNEASICFCGRFDNPSVACGKSRSIADGHGRPRSEHVRVQRLPRRDCSSWRWGRVRNAQCGWQGIYYPALHH